MCQLSIGLLLVTLAGAPQLSAQGTATIRGIVTDAQQRPLDRAQIIVPGTARHAQTDGNGVFVLDSVPPGVISVRATALGYKPHELVGLRVVAGQQVAHDFVLQLSPVMISAIDTPRGFLLYFQMVEPIAGPTTDRAIVPIDSILREVFHSPGFQLLSESVINVDSPASPEWGGMGKTTSVQTTFNARGFRYELSARIDRFDPPRPTMTVVLSEIAVDGTKRTILGTTASVGRGNTVVLGSAQPGGTVGRSADAAATTLILTVRPELRGAP